MAIEVRQMVIKSTVGAEPAPAPGAGSVTEDRLARLREELLEECRAWFLERVREREER